MRLGWAICIGAPRVFAKLLPISRGISQKNKLSKKIRNARSCQWAYATGNQKRYGATLFVFVLYVPCNTLIIIIRFMRLVHRLRLYSICVFLYHSLGF